jgi:ribonuclease P protein component
VLLTQEEEKVEKRSQFELANLKSFFLPRKNRICQKLHFKYVFGNCSRAESASIRLYYVKAYGDSGRVAFVASKKLGNAVKRNYCKRRMREIYRLVQHRISSKYDLVLVGKASLFHQSFDKIQDDFIRLSENRQLLIQPT